MDAPRQGGWLWCKVRSGCHKWETSLSPEATPKSDPAQAGVMGLKVKPPGCTICQGQGLVGDLAKSPPRPSGTGSPGKAKLHWSSCGPPFVSHQMPFIGATCLGDQHFKGLLGPRRWGERGGARAPPPTHSINVTDQKRPTNLPALCLSLSYLPPQGPA